MAKGFAPVSASAALWASDPTGAATTAGPRLAATASEIGWRIDGGKGPFQGGGEYLRMVDRTRVSYREAVRWNDDAPDDRQRLTQALPKSYQAEHPAGFACLQMVNNNRIHAPLYADGPLADIIELVDPKDLLEGLVRRRAIYHWSSFASRSLLSAVALQKIAASGATWIEENTTSGWTEPPSEVD